MKKRSEQDTWMGAGKTQRVFERGEDTTPRVLPDPANCLLFKKSGGARNESCIGKSKLEQRRSWVRLGSVGATVQPT
jgi:hypothetical protein